MKTVFLFSFLFLSLSLSAQNSSLELETIFQEIDTYNRSISPQDSLWRKQHLQGSFSTIDKVHFENVKGAYETFKSRLNSISEKDVSRQEFISRELMLYKLDNTLADIEFKMYLIPMNAEGGYYGEIRNALSGLPLNTKEDYEAYLNWLPSYEDWMDDHLELMKEGVALGIVAPRTVIENNIELLEPWLPNTIEESIFYKPIQSMPSVLSEKEASDIRKHAKKIISKEITPAYEELDEFLKQDYLKSAPEKPGILFLPNGKSYYENRVSYYTTLDVSPDSVYVVGLEEVERIKVLMKQIIEELEFDGTFEEFYTFLRSDQQFYPKTPQELLNRAAWLSKKAEGQLPQLFSKLYSNPFTVTKVPAEIAPTYTAGRYSGGSLKDGRAGEYWVNTYKLESRTLYTLPALTLHEAVPGHHLQGALAQEIEGIPDFRKHFYTSAFGEGWGLYSEYLGEEMGMYTTPYEQFGRYTYEMWRACRLVVDVGIHYKGWTREEALEYLQSNTALSIHEVTTEIDRYIGWPGQAVSYKIGELKIKALRADAEKRLGEDFDIREFHYHLLKNGAVTLPILEQEIESYILAELED